MGSGVPKFPFPQMGADSAYSSMRQGRTTWTPLHPLSSSSCYFFLVVVGTVGTLVLILSPAVSQQSSFLPQRHDPTWPVDGLLEKQPRHQSPVSAMSSSTWR